MNFLVCGQLNVKKNGQLLKIREVNNMEYTHEEILKGLEMIQEICQTSSCLSCPFINGDTSCAITNTSPDVWNIKDNTPAWRAFE